MLDAILRAGNPGPSEVPATILGQNLEATEKNLLGMLSNQLENSKFTGPADVNGLAPPWRASLDFLQASRVEVDSGVSLAGNGSSQLLLSYGDIGALPQAVMQTGCQVRAGESVEAVIWAKARHHPAELRVELRPLQLPRQPYAVATIEISTTYWTRHAVTLEPPLNDAQAVFSLAIAGRGLVWIDQVQLRPAGSGHVSTEMLEHIATLDVPVLRFPGGCLASNYRWRHGTGPVEHRPATLDTANRRLLNYDFGTEEYLQLCLEQGITPHLTVNIGTGTPQEAAAWAEYVAAWFHARGEQPPPAYFQVGNEDHGVHEHSHMTPSMYAETLRAFVPGIRAAYPTARIVAMADAKGMSLEDFNAPWRAAVLAAAAELAIEVLAIHIYRWSDADDGEGELASAVAGAAEGAVELEALLADCHSAGLDSAIGLTEWNFWTSASHWDGPRSYERSGASMLEPYRATHALYASAMLHTFARLAPELELANFYQLVNGMGVFEHRGIDVHDGPMANLFRLYRPAFPSRVRDLELAGAHDHPSGAGPALDALALDDDGGGRWLFVTNRDPTSAASLDLDGFPSGRPEIRALGASGPLEPALPGADVRLENTRLRLPPLTITRLAWPG